MRHLRWACNLPDGARAVCEAKDGRALAASVIASGDRAEGVGRASARCLGGSGE